MSVIDKYNEAKRRMEAALKEAEATMKEALQEGLDELFAQFPAVEAVSWTQFTPYFNDGDECVFSTSASYPSVLFYDDPEDHKDYEWLSEEGFYYGENEELYEGRKPAAKAFEEFLRQFDDDLLKAAFGNHVRVIARKGDIEVDDYSDHY